MSATYAQFMSDPARKENYTFEVKAYNLDTDTVSTLYFCSDSDGFATEAGETPDGQLFDCRMMGGYSRAMGVAAGQGGTARMLHGFISQPYEGVVRLLQFAGDMDTGAAPGLNGVPLRRYSFGGRSAVVKHGGYSPRYGRVEYADYKVLESGQCNGDPRNLPGMVEFLIESKSKRFDTPIQGKKFFGTHLCAQFNGTSDYIDCGEHSAINESDTDILTVGFNIFIESNPGAITSIISCGEPDVDGWRVKLKTNGALEFSTYQLGATQTTTSNVLTLGKWLQVVFKCNPNNGNCKVRIDGEQARASAGAHAAPDTNASRTLYIGCNDSINHFFSGALDEIRIAAGPDFTESDLDETTHRPLDSSEYSSWEIYYNLDDGPGAVTADNKGSLGSAADGDMTGHAPVFHPSCMGRSDLAGRRMPDVWGEVHGWTPAQVDFAQQIYMVHSALCEDVTEVALGGNATAFDLGNSYVSWLQFMLNTTAPGEYDTCFAGGWSFIRLGGQPEYPLTINIKGDKSDATYRDTVAAIIRHIVCTRGNDPLSDPSDIVDAEFDALDAAYTGPVGLAYYDDRTIKDVIDQFARSIGLLVYFRRSDGTLSARQILDPNDSVAVADITTDDVEGLKVLDRGKVVWSVTARYNECPSAVIPDQDLFESLDDDSANFFRRQWRKTEVPRPRLKTMYLDAITFEFETRFIEFADARGEAVRISRLLQTRDQAFSFFCIRPISDLELLDVVSFTYEDLNKYNAAQQRFGTSSTALFYVTGIQEDAARGGIVLDLWRPDGDI